MEYLDALFELYAGKGMTDYMEPLYPYEEEREYQQAYIEQMYRFYGYGMWIVCDRNTGELIGRAGVEHREEWAESWSSVMPSVCRGRGRAMRRRYAVRFLPM